jgi:hypothetical protein
MTYKIGTVELLRARIYDAVEPGVRDVAVAPGVYDLFYDEVAGRYYWEMLGRRSKRVPGFTSGMQSLGNGMFAFHHRPTADVVSDEEALARTAPMTAAAIAEMLDDDICAEGHEEQRLRISITDLGHIARIVPLRTSYPRGLR